MGAYSWQVFLGSKEINIFEEEVGIPVVDPEVPSMMIMPDGVLDCSSLYGYEGYVTFTIRYKDQIASATTYIQTPDYIPDEDA